MMDKLRTAPLPLRRKLLLTALAGAAFFLVGLAAIFFSLDTVTALLSGILAIGLAFKTAELYRLIIAGHYTTVDGSCIAIIQTPLRKYRNIRIIDSQERESGDSNVAVNLPEGYILINGDAVLGLGDVQAKNSTVKYYNLSGLRLTTPPENGIYIRIEDGRATKQLAR